MDFLESFLLSTYIGIFVIDNVLLFYSLYETPDISTKEHDCGMTIIELIFYFLGSLLPPFDVIITGYLLSRYGSRNHAPHKDSSNFVKVLFFKKINHEDK